MEKIRVCIVDDEAPAREELKFLLQKDFPQVSVEGEFDNSGDAFDFLENNDCDLLFLDIEMPEETGIEFAKRLSDELEDVPYIIFATAYNQFAIDAFELDAVDYLLKPIRIERLKKAMAKMEERIKQAPALKGSEGSFQISDLLEQLKNKEQKRSRITITQGDKLIPLDIQNILFATAEDKSTFIYTPQGKYPFNGTLTELEEMIAHDDFFRSHKSFLINVSHIENINIWFNGSYQIKLRGSSQVIPVSRKRSKLFKDKLNIK